MSTQTPEVNNSVTHAAAGNLAFLLSVIRCGESLSADEEAHVRDVIRRLNTVSELQKAVADLFCCECGQKFADADGWGECKTHPRIQEMIQP